MEERLGFDIRRHLRVEHFWKDFLGRLHQPFGPACLLRFEAVHVHRQFRGAFDLREVQELPALKLRAIRKVRVLCQGVVLPAARFVNHFPAPHSRRSVEIEKRSAPGPCAVFDNEVPVEQDRFHVGQQGIVAVQVSPARLHHTDMFPAVGIQEIGNR